MKPLSNILTTMGWLSSRKPQGFRHTYIYIDERREAVRRLRQSRVEAPADADSQSAPADDAMPTVDASALSVDGSTPTAETSTAGPLFVSALAERRRQSRDAAMRLVGAIVIPLLMLLLVLTIFIFLL